VPPDRRLGTALPHRGAAGTAAFLAAFVLLFAVTGLSAEATDPG